MATTTTTPTSWNPSFSVGHPTLDGHHQKLFQMVDELSEAIKGGSAKEGLSRLVDGLSQYTLLHFKAEEDAMRKAGYPDLDAHMKQHAAFVGKVTDLRERLAQGRLILSIEVASFCRKWLVEHIQGTDKKYAPFLKT